jgi:hypothetical protein
MSAADAVVRRITSPDLASHLSRFMQVEASALKAIGLQRAKPGPDKMTDYLRSLALARAGGTSSTPDPS